MSAILPAIEATYGDFARPSVEAVPQTAAAEASTNQGVHIDCIVTLSMLMPPM